jgi:hypothetical protein
LTFRDLSERKKSTPTQPEFSWNRTQTTLLFSTLQFSVSSKFLTKKISSLKGAICKPLTENWPIRDKTNLGKTKNKTLNFYINTYDMILATPAFRMKNGSKLVLKFVDLFMQLNGETSMLEFLTMLSEKISGHSPYVCLTTQTPQIDAFPHLRTMVRNKKM